MGHTIGTIKRYVKRERNAENGQEEAVRPQVEEQGGLCEGSARRRSHRARGVMAALDGAVSAARAVPLNGRKALFCGLAATVVLLVLILALPQLAHAGIIEDFFNNPLKAMCKTTMGTAFGWLASINTGMLTNPFTALFSGGTGDNMVGPGLEGDSAYRKVSSIASGLTGTLGYSILAIATIVQICKMAGRADGNQQLASVKELAFILIYFAVFKSLIDNAVPFCEAFYNVFNNLLQTYFDLGSGSTAISNSDAMVDTLVNTAGDSVWLLVVLSPFITIGCFLAVVISYAVVFFRSIQIYLYTAFAPVALPLLMLDETRSYGTGFIRNYIALLLSGLIISFIIICYPALLSAITNADGWATFVGTFAATAVLCLALARSGGMAKEILGG